MLEGLEKGGPNEALETPENVEEKGLELAWQPQRRQREMQPGLSAPGANQKGWPLGAPENREEKPVRKWLDQRKNPSAALSRLLGLFRLGARGSRVCNPPPPGRVQGGQGSIRYFPLLRAGIPAPFSIRTHFGRQNLSEGAKASRQPRAVEKKRYRASPDLSGLRRARILEPGTLPSTPPYLNLCRRQRP